METLRLLTSPELSSGCHVNEGKRANCFSVIAWRLDNKIGHGCCICAHQSVFCFTRDTLT